MRDYKGENMKLIVCVDDRGGMLFNKRRLSSDRIVTEKIIALCNGEKLLVNPYSYKLFPATENIVCIEEPTLAAKEEWCFAEDWDVSVVLHKVNKIVIFHWNRTYPSDLRFPLDMVRSKWHMEHSEEFPGHSHPRITMEVYSR